MAAPTNAEIAYQQSGLLDRWTLFTTQLRDWLGGTPDGGPNGDGAYPLQNVVGEVFLVPCPAANSAQVTELTDPLEGLQAAVESSVTASQAAQAAAEQARDIAQTYRDAAISASDDASMYATNSANSAAYALTSKNAAATSETNSAASATAAATSETNSAASATAAASSAGDADTDAIAAAQSAQAAANYAAQAGQSAAGKLAWFGVWNIASGTLPPDATVPGFYLVSGTATIGGTAYASGDMLVWGEEGVWHRIDNQQTVASVAGLVGTISVGQLQAALMLGTAAYQNTEAFATAAQGAKANSALQPNTLINVSSVAASSDVNVGTGLRLAASGSTGYLQAGTDLTDSAATLNIAVNHTATGQLQSLNVYAITTTFNGSVVVTAGTASDAPITFDGPDTQYQLLRFNRGGERRWAFGINSNAAGMLRLFRYGDDSTYLGSVLDFDRATGAASFNAPVTIGSGRKLSKITVSSSAPGTLADGELYLQY